MKVATYNTAEQAVTHASLQTLAEMKVDDFVGQLKQRGIASLEDLAKASIGVAQSGISGGIAAIDPEDFPICYKFTVRPHGPRNSDLASVLDRVRNSSFGR
jgi:glutaminase